MTHLELLGYHDSGMEGWPQNDAPGSFWHTPVADAASRLAALMRHYEPQVVVTYDENGFYGHPDHIQANRVTHAAIEECGIPTKLYYTAMARSTPARLRRHHGRGRHRSCPNAVQENPDFGTPDELITTTSTAARSPAEVRLAGRARQPERQHLLPEDGRGAVRRGHGLGELRAGAGLDRGARARRRPLRRSALTTGRVPSRACAPPGERGRRTRSGMVPTSRCRPGWCRRERGEPIRRGTARRRR